MSFTPYRMNARVKELWTKALRSGKYPQDRGYLRTKQGYCCLGVLCDLAVIEGVIPQPQDTDPDDNEMGWYYYGTSALDDVLPQEVAEWAGLKNPGYPEDNPLVTVNDSVTSLAELNDDGYTFARIADIIEENL